MKKNKFIVFFILITSVLHCWNSIGFKINDHDLIENYQLPTWGYTFGNIVLSGNGRYHRTNTANEIFYENYLIRLSPDFLRTFESEKINYSLSADVDFYMGYDRSQNEQYENDDIGRFYNFYPVLNGIIDYYIKDNIFMNFSANSRYSYYEENNSQDSRDRIERQISTKSFLGFGIGKVREVSPIFRALRLRERVEALNKGITLSENQITKLADKFALYPQFASIYDRYEKYFWKEISPILGNDFDAFNLSENLYLTEVMQEYIKRYQGNEILFGINFWHDYSIDRTGEKAKEIYIGPRISFNHFNNINLKYQFGLFTEISYLNFLTEDSNEDSKFIFYLSNRHLFDFTDRIRWNSDISMDYNYNWFENTKGYLLTIEFSSVIDYFIENNFSLYFQLNSRLTHVDKELYGNNSFDNHYSNLKRDERVNFHFGCRYYFGSIY